jgi:N-acetylmuramoyl-L-alanine amidase/LysM domain
MSLPLRLLALLIYVSAMLALGGCQMRGGGSKPTYSQETIRHQVQVGDTITMVATRYSVSVGSIIDANNLRDRFLKPGSVLYIPGGKMPPPDPVVIEAPQAPIEPIQAPKTDNNWYIPRSAWAREAVVLSRTKPMGGTPNRITIHHSGNVEDTRFNSREWLQRIDANHISGTGHPEPWACIGYHFIIDASGKIYEGRPIKFQGAHAGNDDVNRLNIGVCLIGDFDVARVPAAQRTVLLEVLDRLCLQYGINRASVFGHSHFKTTACPGRNLVTIINAYADRPTPPEDPNTLQASLPAGATRFGTYFSTAK